MTLIANGNRGGGGGGEHLLKEPNIGRKSDNFPMSFYCLLKAGFGVDWNTVPRLSP